MYYKAHERELSKKKEEMMRLVDEMYTRYPFFGTRMMRDYLSRNGYEVQRHEMRWAYNELGLQSVAPGPHTSCGVPEHKKYPYLLRGLEIERPDQVWSTDITYIRMRKGFMYLVAIIDWYSRYVLDWELSISLEKDFCVETLKRTMERGSCEIFNTDQGSQFTSEEFTGVLEDNGVKISMDGKGRALDNIFVERLWRTVKYECVYLHEWETARDLRKGLKRYFEFYNYERPHQSLTKRTPYETYQAGNGSYKDWRIDLMTQRSLTEKIGTLGSFGGRNLGNLLGIGPIFLTT